MNLDVCRSALFRDNSDRDIKQKTRDNPSVVHREYQRRMMSSMCNVSLDSLDENALPRSILNFSKVGEGGSRQNHPIPSNDTRHQQHSDKNPSRQAILNVMHIFESLESRDKRSYQRVQAAMQRNRRMQEPVKCLEAPDVVHDDFVNLIDWGTRNVVAIGLQYAVYVFNWDTQVSEVLCDETDQDRGDDNLTLVTAVKWCQMPGKEHMLLVATEETVSLWDTVTMWKLWTTKHNSPIESLAFNHSWVTLGSEDGRILNYDPRAPWSPVVEYRGHQGRVCSLKWNQGGKELASGGEDNTVCIWDATMNISSHCNRSAISLLSLPSSNTVARPRLTFRAHTSTVKALDWCPFSSHILASGGAHGDGTIRIWNAKSGDIVSSVRIGSNATSLIWSTQAQHANEFMTGHACGSLALWKYNGIERRNGDIKGSLDCLHQWPGHESHVLGLALSPGGMVVSVSTDETMNFWTVFDGAFSNPKQSALMPTFSTLDIPAIR
jgi:cell division cycle protein 20 (cofactor of APC complex)